MKSIEIGGPKKKALFFIKSLPLELAKSAFFVFILCVVFELFLGFVLYFEYGFPDRDRLDGPSFQKEELEKVISKLDELEQVDTNKEHSNPFGQPLID